MSNKRVYLIDKKSRLVLAIPGFVAVFTLLMMVFTEEPLTEVVMTGTVAGIGWFVVAIAKDLYLDRKREK